VSVASSQKESIRIQVDLKDDDPLRVDGVALVQSVRDFGDHVKLAGRNMSLSDLSQNQ